MRWPSGGFKRLKIVAKPSNQVNAAREPGGSGGGFNRGREKAVSGANVKMFGDNEGRSYKDPSHLELVAISTSTGKLRKVLERKTRPM